MNGPRWFVHWWCVLWLFLEGLWAARYLAAGNSGAGVICIVVAAVMAWLAYRNLRHAVRVAEDRGRFAGHAEFRKRLINAARARGLTILEGSDPGEDVR